MRLAADDRQHQREAVLRGAHDRLRRAADRDPRRQAPGGRRRVDRLLVQARAGRSGPGHGRLLAQLGEELQLLLEELLVLLEGVAEERERLDEGAAAEDHLGAPAGDRVEGREALEDPHRIVRAQHGHGRAEPDAARPPRDRGQHDVGGGDGEVVAVVLAHAEEVEPDLVGQHALGDHVADHLRLREARAVGVDGDVAERVQAEEQIHRHIP